jgi:hypothetical protein
MLRYLILVLLLGITIDARAEPVPEFALDKDFQNCMGGETPQQDAQRAQYCNCIRDSMKGWSLDEYGSVAEQSKTVSTQQAPKPLMDIAQACISKVLK